MGEQDKTIEFQRVILKEDARTKFGGSNPMQPTVIAWEEAISKADHSDIEVVLPLVLYLSTARLWKDGNKKRQKGGVFSRTDAYNHCLDAQHGLDIAFRYLDTLKSSFDGRKWWNTVSGISGDFRSSK